MKKNNLFLSSHYLTKILLHITTAGFILAYFQSLVFAETQKPELAIIIDDIGYNLSNGRAATELPFKVTLAVLPFTPHGKQLAELGHRNGKEIMLHTPMSNERNIPLGPGALTNNISSIDLVDTLNKNLANIPYVKGVNNHMGSQLTQNGEIMSWLMAYLKTKQLYFVDSRTTAKTQALRQAQAQELPSRKRDVFLDDTRKSDYIRRQLILALKTARKQGSAIAIGHPYNETLKVLKEAQTLANSHSVNLVLVSDLFVYSKTNQKAPLPYCPFDAEKPDSNIFVTEQTLFL